MQTFGRKMLDKMVDNKNLLKTTEKMNQKKTSDIKNPDKKRKIPSVYFGRYFWHSTILFVGFFSL